VRSSCFFFHHRRGSKDPQATKVNVDSAAATFDDTRFRTTPFDITLFDITLFGTITVNIAPSSLASLDITNTLTIVHYRLHLQKERHNQDHDSLLRGHEILTSLYSKDLPTQMRILDDFP
jgi:hypothetical protein